MKRLFAVFVLTPAEQRLVILVMILLVAGTGFKYYRDYRLSVSHPTQTAPSLSSPLPAER